MFAITGMGIMCALGADLKSVRKSLHDGMDGITDVIRFDTSVFTAQKAGLLEKRLWDELGLNFPNLDRRTAMAYVVAREALEDAKYRIYGNDRIALVYGVCVGGKHGDDESADQTLMRNRLQNQASTLSAMLGINGPSLITSTACASSAHALGLASYLLRMNFVDAVMVGGAGDVAPEMYAGFHALGVMSPSPCAPYSIPPGLNLGEGAAFFVIQKSACEDIDCWGYLAGYGSALDAYHATTPDPTGTGVSRALDRAIKDAGISPDQIEYINTHGTGTIENDKSEWLGIKGVLKDHSNNIPVSSSKSFVGHTGGAAGIIEAAITLIAMKDQVVPPTLHCTKKRRLSPPDIVDQIKPRSHKYSIAASLNAAFGGGNAAIILSRKPLRSVNQVVFKPVAIKGTGTVLPECTHSVFSKNNLDTVRLLSQKISENLSGYTKNRDDRYLDPVSRYLTAATSRALKGACIHNQEELSVKRGLYVGAAHVPSSSLDEFESSQIKRGLQNISPHAFARIVMNAATGAAAELVRLKGPSMTIASGVGAGLVALVMACIELSINDELQLCIAAAADELGTLPLRLHALAGRSVLPVESAAACILARPQSTDNIFISGIGLTGPESLDTAVRQALSSRPRKIDYIFDASDQSRQSKLKVDKCMSVVTDMIGKPEIIRIADYWGFAESATSLLSVTFAYTLLSEKLEHSRALVLTSSSMNCSCAVLIERLHKV